MTAGRVRAASSAAVLHGCRCSPGVRQRLAPPSGAPNPRTASRWSTNPVKPTDECLPIAPDSARVDLATPTFSKPTSITNPLHPTSAVAQAIYGGQVDDKPFRTEVTLMPGTKPIQWRGTTVDTAIVQYVAYSDGRIHEVALDWYAQADDGSVWYFGEDVFNFEDGRVADTEGTWIASDETPAAMIMPAQATRRRRLPAGERARGRVRAGARREDRPDDPRPERRHHRRNRSHGAAHGRDE